MNTLIIIDAGHGDNTPGKRSPVWSDGHQLFEWEFNRDIANRIYDQLYIDGLNVHLLVPETKDIELTERTRRVNRLTREANGHTILLSIHANAGGGSGWECYTTPGLSDSDILSSLLYYEAKIAFPNARMRVDYTDGDADKEENFYMLKKTICPAILTENFFMDNESDCRGILMRDEGREAIAQMHVRAVKRYMAIKGV